MEETPTRELLLRQRLVEIAQRRVAEELVEPVVREALGESPQNLSLREALRALRHAIAESYLAPENPDRPKLANWDPTTAPIPAEALDRSELGRGCERALRSLSEDSPAAVGYLRQLAAGATADEVAARVKVSREVLYQRLFRGRTQLDRILVAGGVRT